MHTESDNPLHCSNDAEGTCPVGYTGTDCQFRNEYCQLAEQYRRTAKAMASAAHDLNTPLSILSGYIDLLRTEKLGSVTSRQKTVLEDMQASAMRLKQLVQDFLTFSGFETGRASINLSPAQIKDCVGEICRLWLNRFQHRGIAFYLRDDVDVPVFPFDYQRVQRIVANLLENALRFAGSGGTVWVSVEPIFWERRAQIVAASLERRQVSVHRPNAVRISVCDTGPGIAPEFHQEIFEDFVKGDASGDGTGLGLAIARRLVQAHSGRIWVESQPGSGSTFVFTLPFVPAAPAQVSKGQAVGQ